MGGRRCPRTSARGARTSPLCRTSHGGRTSEAFDGALASHGRTIPLTTSHAGRTLAVLDGPLTTSRAIAVLDGRRIATFRRCLSASHAGGTIAVLDGPLTTRTSDAFDALTTYHGRTIAVLDDTLTCHGG